jgi:small redox-active disulfide protein 2
VYVIPKLGMKPMKIEIFSTNCVKCRRLEFNLQQALAELDINADVVKITNIDDMIRRGIMSVPALAIDGDIKMVGIVPRVSDLKMIISGKPAPL